MRIFRIIMGAALLIIIALAFIITTQQHLTHIPVAPWELWSLEIFTFIGVVSGIFQLDFLLNSFKETINFIWSGMKSFWSWIWRRPAKQKFSGVISIIFVTILVVLHSLGFYTNSFPRHIFPSPPPIPTLRPTPTLPPSLADRTCSDEQKQGINAGIGVTLSGEDCIGISYGNAVFNLNRDKRPVQDLLHAVQEPAKYPLGSQAQYAWGQAILDDPSNAEPLIYRENIRVQSDDYPHPYVTLIVAVVLTGKYYYDGSEVLQGVYLQQMEHNKNCRDKQPQPYKNCILLKVLVANVGSGKQDEADYAKSVTDQMIQAIDKDPTIVGVMSGSTSNGTINIQRELTTGLSKLHLPMIPIVASKATDDELSTANYLFRVVPPDYAEAQTAADYAKNSLHAKKVAILYRKSNAYSLDLEGDFFKDSSSPNNTYQIVGSPTSYDPADSDSIQAGLEKVLTSNPDILYCACYALDVNVILQWLANHKNYQNLQILGGDALYELGGYKSPQARSQLHRLHFTAFTYPDLWNILEHPGISKPPQAIEDYATTYGASAGDGIYGLTRMTPNVAVAYDAMLVLATSCDQVFTAQNGVTASSLKATIAQQDIIGISGRIVFGRNSNISDPYNKIIVVIQNVNMKYQYANFEEGVFV